MKCELLGTLENTNDRALVETGYARLSVQEIIPREYSGFANAENNEESGFYDVYVPRELLKNVPMPKTLGEKPQIYVEGQMLNFHGVYVAKDYNKTRKPYNNYMVIATVIADKPPAKAATK